MKIILRVLFVLLVWPAILWCDGWRLTLSGAWAYIKGEHLEKNDELR